MKIHINLRQFDIYPILSCLAKDKVCISIFQALKFPHIGPTHFYRVIPVFYRLCGYNKWNFKMDFLTENFKKLLVIADINKIINVTY